MKTHHTHKGFTLLELLTVMAIMAMLSTLAATGYFAAVRGIAKQRGTTGLMNALTLARQRACTDGARTSVVCYNVWSDASSSDRKDCRPSYVICKVLGRFTDISGTQLADEFTPIDRLFNLPDYQGVSSSSVKTYPIRLYNLTRGGWSDVQQEVKRKPYGAHLGFPDRPGSTYETPEVLLYFTRRDGTQWEVGDAYGVAVSTVSSLPKNVYFGGTLMPTSPNSNVIIFEFRPDGLAEAGSASQIDLCMVKEAGAVPKPVKQINVNTRGEITSRDL